MNLKNRIEEQLKKIPFIYDISKYLFGQSRALINFLFPKRSKRRIMVISASTGIAYFIKDLYLLYKFYKTEPINKKLAIHIHLYYLDLNDELISYLRNMPYRYDLFLTITNIEEKGYINDYYISKLKTTNLDHLTVLTVPNAGRNWAPLLITLKPYIFQYDFFCHLHTKKSLYTGNQQDDWRKHLYGSLLGSVEIIKKIINTMISDHLGIMYPSTYHSMPYWVHHWLSNKTSAKSLGVKTGITFDTSVYADFPVGSMFWFRPDALSNLFNAGFRITDFQPEPIANDGTIVHAIERSICIIARNKKYSYGEFDLYNNTVRINNGAKNLQQYWGKTAGGLYSKLKKFNHISFDIFDTIISRKLFTHKNLFDIIASRITDKPGISIKFAQLRENTESGLRKNLKSGEDVTIGQIYSKIKESTALSDEEITEMMNIEIQTELDFSVPRNDIQKLVKRLIAENKKIYLISDMYLTADIIRRLLIKHDFPVNDVEILVSSETGLRKDTGKAWDEYKDLIEVHVGDNEHSDIQMCVDRKIPCFHVMSSSRLFELSFNPDLKMFSGTGDSIIAGLIIDRIFNSPFSLNKTNGRPVFNTHYDLGYCVFGPLLYYFTFWLSKKAKETKIDKLLFLAREGYWLQRIYEKYSALTGEHTDNIYFLTSRRAVVLPCFEDFSDISASLGIVFSGTISELLKHRFGIVDESADNSRIFKLPTDKNKVSELLKSYQTEILKNAAIEKKAYTGYIKSLGLSGKEKIGIVDVGFAGTIQKYLSKIMDNELVGLYMVTNEHARKNKIRTYGCYGEYLNSQKKNKIYDYSLFIETILTTTYGQLERFVTKEDTIEPVFKRHVLSKKMINGINEVMDGVLNFTEDAFRQLGRLNEPTKEASSFFYNYMVTNPDCINSRIRDIFYIDDYFTSSKKIDIYDLYYGNKKNPAKQGQK